MRLKFVCSYVFLLSVFSLIWVFCTLYNVHLWRHWQLFDECLLKDGTEDWHTVLCCLGLFHPLFEQLMRISFHFHWCGCWLCWLLKPFLFPACWLVGHANMQTKMDVLVEWKQQKHFTLFGEFCLFAVINTNKDVFLFLLAIFSTKKL